LPALIIIGTDHAVTQSQVDTLEQADSRGRCELIRLSWDVPPALDRLAVRLGEFGAVLLSGGDTARYVLDAFAAEEIILGGEVEPGIPWGRIRGGAADGLTVVTKSGGFGSRRSLAGVVEAVSSGAPEQNR
jgi:uncharacterized protein YgbK (DUF1537 family)